MNRHLRTLKGKILLIFIVSVTVQIAGIAGFGLYLLNPYIHDTYQKHQSKITDALYWEINNLKEKFEDYSVSMIGDAQIQAFLEKADKAGYRGKPVPMSSELRYSLLAYTDYDSRVKAIYLMDNNQNVYSVNAPGTDIQSYLLQKQGAFVQEGARAVWTTDYNESYVVMYRVVNNNTTDLTKKKGILCLLIDKEAFLETMEQFRMDEHQKMMLTNRDNTLQLGDVEEYHAATMETPEFEHYMLETRETKEWRLYTWVSTAAVFAPVNSLFGMLLLETIVFAVCAVVLFGFLSGKITKPISQMRDAMHKIGEGNRRVRVPVIGNDELGELALAMNKMSVEIEELMEEIRKDQKRKQMLELRALQYQINPHFLYNALDSIQMFARKSHDENSARMVTQLSSFFRIFLSQGNEFIRLREEIEGVIYYLNIQKIRFPDQFDWRIETEEGVEELVVMKFILQPLVENCISHGIQGQGEKGTVWIGAYMEQETVVIQVRDNGIGMIPEALERLQWLLDAPDLEQTDAFAGGFAMRNVHQRLKLFYGKECGLHIESVWEEGTCITIRIPRKILDKPPAVLPEGT